jgi:hypothetical protein
MEIKVNVARLEVKGIQLATLYLRSCFKQSRGAETIACAGFLGCLEAKRGAFVVGVANSQ